MKKLIKKITIVSMFAIAMLGFTGCQQDDIKPESSFSARMTDSPGEFSSLVLTITKVEAYMEGRGFVTLSNEPKTVDICQLVNGKEIKLAESLDAEAGFYTKLRIHFGSSGSVTSAATGITTNLNVGLNSYTDIEIATEYSAEADASVLVDFQVAQSIIESLGNYVFEPVITWVEDENTGAQGRLEGQAKAMISFSDGESSIDTYSDAEGRFLLRGLEAGEYDCHIFPFDESSYPKEVTIENVVIVDGEIKQMGTLQLQ